MKYLYLQTLRLRVWILRRRLRQMGFREAADRNNADTILRLQRNSRSGVKRYLRWLELAVLIVGLVIWVLFFVRPLSGINEPPKSHKSSNSHRELKSNEQSVGRMTSNRSIA